jgi:phage tail-like protein
MPGTLDEKLYSQYAGLQAFSRKPTVATPGVPFGPGPREERVPTPPAPAAPAAGADPKQVMAAVRFQVVIDGHDLGNDWVRVEGLSVRFELAEYRAGDGQNHHWIEPAYTVYSNVKLSRAATLDGTGRVTSWLMETIRQPTKATGTISGYVYSAQPGATWQLRGVLPVAWTGPVFDAHNSSVAMETLELAHDGFLHD